MCILPQNASRRDCNGKCIEWIEGHYLEVVVEVYLTTGGVTVLYPWARRFIHCLVQEYPSGHDWRIDDW